MSLKLPGSLSQLCTAWINKTRVNQPYRHPSKGPLNPNHVIQTMCTFNFKLYVLVFSAESGSDVK